MPRTFTDSRLANLGAASIHAAYEAYHDRFRAITRRARAHFEAADWRGLQLDAAARLDLYDLVLDVVVGELRQLLGPRASERLVWASMKAVYSGSIAGHPEWELAETFFNSVTRRVFATVGVDTQIEFVDSDFEPPVHRVSAPLWRTYRAPLTPADLMARILADFRFQVRCEDAERDARLAADAIAAHLAAAGLPSGIDHAQIVRSVFFRGRSAYVVGRLWCGPTRVPLVLALRHGEGGLVVDAVLLSEDDVSILFSFTRAHFHVEADRPCELVRFLREIMPLKPVADLYTAIGYHKHGKTELYRHLLHHLRETTDRFVIAPGAPGMVMLVFTLPSYDLVFKVIRDRVAEPKTVTRDEVMAKYRLVFKHDRAGRLVDAHEFEHLEFDRARFSEPLLEAVRRDAAETVRVDERKVVIHHLYVERRVQPLDLFVARASPDELRPVLIDYGWAIKDLAAANIFPGDLLLRNFGVTRHGRVVSYDYDELRLMDQCRFAHVPSPRDEIEEWSAEPWFPVHENDCFPAEFRRWLGLAEPWDGLFLDHHADLYTVRFWRDLQERIRAGEVMDILPYAEHKRLQHRRVACAG